MTSKTVNWLCQYFFCAVILFSGFTSAVVAKEIYIVTSDSSVTTQQIRSEFKKKFPNALSIPSDFRGTKEKNAIYITIGPAALRAMLSQNESDGVIISAFTSSQAYQSILEVIPAPRKAAVTAIYADPSLLNQLRLISLLYKKPPNVVVLLSDKTSYLENSILTAANQTHINVRFEKLSGGESINHTLTMTAKVPVILATSDNAIFSQDNIRNILLSSYRRNQSVIGFSPSLVKAGALATTYSDIEDITAQIEELVASYLFTEKLPQPEFPKYFKTVVNENVAHSLNMVVHDDVLKFAYQPQRKQQ